MEQKDTQKQDKQQFAGSQPQQGGAKQAPAQTDANKAAMPNQKSSQDKDFSQQNPNRSSTSTGAADLSKDKDLDRK